MAQLVVGAAGAVIGGFLGGPGGAIQGFAIGYGLGGALFPQTQKAPPPQLMDLRVVGAEYGQPIPYVRGAIAVAGQVWWNSDRHPTTTTTASGGKGDSGGVETSVTTYDIDLLIGLTDNPIVAVRRVWDNGKLIWTAADDSDAESVSASASTPPWSRMTVYTGADDQLPDPTYEAEVGTANAPAYRGRGSVFIEALQLGQAGIVPNLTFEVVVDGSVIGPDEPIDLYDGTSSNKFFSTGDDGGGYTFQPRAQPMTRIWASESGGAGTPKVGLVSLSLSGSTRLGGATLDATAIHGGSMDYDNNLWVPRHSFFGGNKLWRVSATDFSIGLVNLPSGSMAGDVMIVNQGGAPEIWGFTATGNSVAAFRLTDLDFGANTCTLTTISNPTNLLLTMRSRWFNRGERISGRVYGLALINSVAKWGYFDTGTNVFTSFDDTESWVTVSSQAPLVGVDECIYGIRSGSPGKAAKYTKDGVFVAETAALPSWNNWGTYGGPLFQDTNGVLWVRGYQSSGQQVVWKIQASDMSILDTILFDAATNTEWPSFIRGDLGTGIAVTNNGGSGVHPNGGLGYLFPGEQISIDPPTVQEVVEDLCERAGLESGQIDASGLSSITRTVRALAISQIAPTRQALETLASTYFFEMVESDKIYFVPRGGSTVASIPYLDLGASAGEDAGDPLPLKQANDLEIPAQIALTYINVNNDYQPGTEYSDRLISAAADTVETVQLAIGLTPSEAKAVVDTMLLDQAASVVSTTISLLGDYCALEPTDPVLIAGPNGESFRMRLVRKTDSYPVMGFEAVIDDTSILTQLGITDVDYSSSTVIEPPVETSMELMDIPILRDADDDAGFYVATKGSGTPYSGSAVFKSADDVEFERVATVKESAVMGSCTSTLGDWTGPRVFDEVNTVTVDVGDGTLASSTRDHLLDNQQANAILIGSEVIQFRTATLVSPGVYTLSGLLRGCRGTEWAMTGHASSERCVRLRAAGVRRVTLANNELGVELHYKGVTLGRAVSTANSEEFTSDGVGLKPFSPVDIRAARDASNNITFTWQRRSRLSVRAIGDLGISVPLGEESEDYRLRIYSSGTFATLVRTITASTPTASYTAAQQTTDGLTPGNPVNVRLYQRSAVVGLGYKLERTL